MANLVEQEVRVDEELRISYQGLTVEFTVVLQLNQGVCARRCCIIRRA